MNKGYIKLSRHKTTKTKKQSQVKFSKSQIYTKFHKIPEINFENRQLTSFSGIIIFQLLFKLLGLKKFPDASTISSLSQLDAKSVHNILQNKK
jgi:hypothetical protein